MQGRTGAEVGRAGKQEQGYILGTDYFYTHACMYARTHTHTHTHTHRVNVIGLKTNNFICYRKTHLSHAKIVPPTLYRNQMGTFEKN